MSWSPDGSWIAIDEMEMASRHTRLVSVDGRGGEVELGLGSSGPLWSPAGDRIAYMSECTIGVVRTDGSNSEVVANGCYYDMATWSPDGRSLLHMLDVGGGWDLLSTTAAPTPDGDATVTVVPRIPVSNQRSWPGRGDVSWQPVFQP